MSTPDVGRPLTIDYTSRDFEALRLALIERVRNRIPEWRGEDPTDFGVAMVEAFSHVGDIINYYIDRVANETTLLTAVQRRSILNLARSYGYVPSGYSPARLTLRLTPKAGITDELTIPKDSVFSYQLIDGDRTIILYFTLTGSAVLNAAGSEVNYADVSAINARAIGIDFPADPETPLDVSGEILTEGSSGEPNQTYILSKDQVIEDSVSIFVQNGDRYGRWNRVANISDAGPNDPVFEVVLTSDNRTAIIFGDGVAGAIPNIYETIKVQYLFGGGVQGNIPVTTPFSQLNTYYIPGLDIEETTALSNSFTAVATTSGVGGSDPDTDEIIRTIAPSTLITSNRAVSLKDYSGIALRTRGVAKAVADSAIWTSVNVYVAPARTSTTTDPFPLFDETNTNLTSEWISLESAVQESFVDKTQIGVSVTVLPPSYSPVKVSVKFTVRDGYEPSSVISDIRDALLTQFDYNAITFGAKIYPENVESALQSIPGVFTASVTELYRDGSTPGRFPLLGSTDEYFILREQDITIDPFSNDAEISGFTFDEVYGLYPTFDPDFFDYSLTIFAEDDELVIDIDDLPETARATISGELYDGTPIGVATTEDVTEITIVITAENGLTTRVYTITAIKEI
jgi:hypothetical protein